jgi:hypothetical protein
MLARLVYVSLQKCNEWMAKESGRLHRTAVIMLLVCKEKLLESTRHQYMKLRLPATSYTADQNRLWRAWLRQLCVMSRFSYQMRARKCMKRIKVTWGVRSPTGQFIETRDTARIIQTFISYSAMGRF